MYTGQTHPNYGEIGMESAVPTGTGAALPYGQAAPGASAGLVSTSSQVGNQDSAVADIGYSRYTPRAGFADRLSANIVGGNSDPIADGGYSGGATTRI